MPKLKIPKIVQLAEKLEEDIRKRGLVSGDIYMNAAEVAKKLRTSGSTANRVLQILAGRGVVERAQKRGTIIVNPNPTPPARTIQRIHMITFQDSVKQSGLMNDPVIVGMQRSLPSAMIQFNFLPPLGDSTHLENLISEAKRSPDLVGIVLTKAPYHAQKMVEASGLPTVVHGYLHPSVTNLAWITIDYEASGKLIGKLFVKQKFNRLVVVLPERAILPGDHRLISGITQQLKVAKYDAGTIQVCCLPQDEDVLHTWLKHEIGAQKDGVMLACHPEMLAAAPLKGLRKLGLSRKRCEVVVLDEHGKVQSKLSEPLPRIYSPVPEEEMGAHIAELLNAQLQNNGGPTHEVLGVELVK